MILAVMAVAPRAHAQAAGAQAEVLFRQGRELLLAGRLAEACSAFEQSQKLEPATTTLLNLAACREKNGQYASAWGYFLQAERETRAAMDADGIKLHDIAKARAAALEPRVSKLTISVSSESHIDGLEIMRGTTPVEPGAWNRALPVDGGTYTVTARAPGATPWTTTVIVGREADTRTLDIPKLQRTVPDTAVGHDDETADEHDEPPPLRRRRLALPLAVGTVALLGLGGALAFELSAQSTFDASQAEPNPMASDVLFEKANQRRYAAQALAVVGLAAGGAAVWLYVRSAYDVDVTPGAVSRRGMHVVPVVAAEFSGFELHGGF